MNNPIIRIEVDHLRTAMVHAFSQQLLNTDEMFRAAIAKVCTPENVQGILDEAANRHLEAAIEEEVKNFISFGEGRKIIAARVQEKLREELR